jgi:hypothetical protein
MKTFVVLPFVAVGFLFTLADARHAEAIVYCKTVGVPKGCVVRPAPVVRRAVVRTTPVNLGGPVNRVGVR